MTSPLTLSITPSHSSTLEVRAALQIAANKIDSAFVNISPVAKNIKELDTNDSVIDACVRLWVIADFFMLQELKDEAVGILEKHCDEMMKAMCFVGDQRETMAISDHEFDALLAQLFRGVETAYTQFPHSVLCQQVLVSFSHAIRFSVFGTRAFSHLMFKAPLQFSHELFMATLNGRVSKWVSQADSEYDFQFRQGSCTGCNQLIGEYRGTWVVDSSMKQESRDHWQLHVPWRCISCFEKYGLGYVCAENENP